MERAAFRTAFEFGRAMGVKVSTNGDNWGISAGIFQGNNNFSNATKEGYIAAVRATYGNNINNGKWLLGVSGRYKNEKDNGTIGYKARSITNLSMIMSDFKRKAIKETLIAAEAALTSGAFFFASAEYAFVNARDAINIASKWKFFWWLC